MNSSRSKRQGEPKGMLFVFMVKDENPHTLLTRMQNAATLENSLAVS